jgi:hypothetical protein
VGRMVGVAAIGDAWLIETQSGFWPKPGRSAVSGENRVRVPAGRVTTNKQTISSFNYWSCLAACHVTESPPAKIGGSRPAGLGVVVVSASLAPLALC